MSDYCLIQKIKESTNKREVELAECQLWEKYQPLIGKHKTMLFRIGFGHEDLEDFVQDSYVLFKKALDFIKIDKIKDPNKFYFYVHFNNFIRNEINYRYTKKERFLYFELDSKDSHKKFIGLNESYVFAKNTMSEGVDHAEFMHDYIQNVSGKEDDHIYTVNFEDFINKYLDETQKQIVKYRSQGYKLREIGEFVGYTAASIKLKLDKIEKLYYKVTA